MQMRIYTGALKKSDGVDSPSGETIRRPAQSGARYVTKGLSIEAIWAPPQPNQNATKHQCPLVGAFCVSGGAVGNGVRFRFTFSAPGVFYEQIHKATYSGKLSASWRLNREEFK